jgi:hypothetical protein
MEKIHTIPPIVNIRGASVKYIFRGDIMITLNIIPNFDFKSKYKEAGEYLVTLPQQDKDIIIWSMWCSSLRWAIQDTYCYCDNVLDDLFGENNWEVMFNKSYIKNKNINIDKYQTKRQKYHLPQWEVDKVDKYRGDVHYI